MRYSNQIASIASIASIVSPLLAMVATHINFVPTEAFISVSSKVSTSTFSQKNHKLVRTESSSVLLPKQFESTDQYFFQNGNIYTPLPKKCSSIWGMQKDENEVDNDTNDATINDEPDDESEEQNKKARLVNITSIPYYKTGTNRNVAPPASIVTTTFDAPIRYLLPIWSSPSTTTSDEAVQPSYVMIDVPPFSNELYTEIMAHLNPSSSSDNYDDIHKPMAILITNKNSIHFDDDMNSGVYSKHRSDLESWIRAFPGIEIVMHRIDVPRDLNVNITTLTNDNDETNDETNDVTVDSIPMITQILDGYGPWAWNTQTNRFVESGLPLTVIEWDDDKIANFFKAGTASIDPNNDNADVEKNHRERIRSKEQNKPLLAIYTPGHTMGSMCYISPPLTNLEKEMDVYSSWCASGFSIPPPDLVRTLDYKGYISTNRGTVRRQVTSMRELNSDYIDRFRCVLPSRGNPMLLDNEESAANTNPKNIVEERRIRFNDIISAYEKIGNIYESLGVSS